MTGRRVFVPALRREITRERRGASDVRDSTSNLERRCWGAFRSGGRDGQPIKNGRGSGSDHLKSLGGTSMRKNLGQFIASVHVSAFCNAAAAATRGQGHDVCGIAGRRNLFAPIAAGLLAFANVCPQAADAAVDQVIDPPAGYLYATPLAISPDSSKVLVLLEDGSGNTVVNLWTANEGFQPLLLPGYPFSTTYRVSNDFSVVVSAGYGNGSSSAFVWSATEGLQAIEPLTGDQTTAWVAVSADGSTVLGKSRTSSVPFTERDFVWTRATGTQEIASPPGCQIQNLLSIADDGSSAVGYMSCSGHSAGVYWSPGTGAQFMPTIPGALPRSPDACLQTDRPWHLVQLR